MQYPCFRCCCNHRHSCTAVPVAATPADAAADAAPTVVLLLLLLPPVVVFATAVVYTDDVVAAAAVLICACPLPGCAHSAFVHGHLGSFGLVQLLFMLICAHLPLFVLVWVVGACLASVCTRLCLASLSLVPVLNIWLVHIWSTDSPLYYKLFTCIRTIDQF